jgi:tripartite-type tricarboxylate transporter receptor subunit TctC
MQVSSFSLPVLLAFAFVGNCVSPAAAQPWPERPMTMVVPFAAGGGTDLLGRIVSKQLAEVLGQQVVVENVGGAGGMLGSARVVKSAPDGYTMVTRRRIRGFFRSFQYPTI